MTIREQEPLEITNAKRKAWRYLVLGAVSALSLGILELVHAPWGLLFTVGITAVIFMCLHTQHFGYAQGYRRGLAAGRTWREPTSGTRSDAAKPPRGRR